MSKTYEIETGVAVANKPRGRPVKYPFAAMKVGKSFFVPTDDADGRMIRTACDQHTRRNYNGARKYRILKVEGGTRVWRLE